MALNINDRYPAETAAPTPQYPYGAFRDRSSPTATDGTKLQEDWSNDFFALHWALLKNAGMTPNGKADTVESSQYFDALIEVIKKNSQKLELSNATNGARTTVAASEKSVGDLNKLKVNKSGDTMTGDLRVETTLPSIVLRNNTIPANNSGARVNFANVAGVGTFTTTDEDGGRTVKHTLPNRSGVLALGNTAVGADTGQLQDTVTGVTFKWGEVNYSNNPSGSVTVTFPTPFESACYNVQLTRKTVRADQHGKAGALLVSKSRTGFVVALNKFNETQTGSARGFSWLAIGK